MAWCWWLCTGATFTVKAVLNAVWPETHTAPGTEPTAPDTYLHLRGEHTQMYTYLQLIAVSNNTFSILSRLFSVSSKKE